MKRFLTACATLIVLLAAAGCGYLWFRSEEAMDRVDQSLAKLKARVDAADQQVLHLRRDLAAVQAASVGRAQMTVPPPVVTSDTVEPPKVPEGPVLSAAIREVLVNVEQCGFAARTLRCTFNITNQSGLEKNFILGIGGRNSRFEEEEGGTTLFDDVGNDYLSAGGGVANRNVANYDSYTTYRLEKTLTPNVKTEAFVRFDEVDPKATRVKLLRVKWSDGEAWVPMDFRNIPITRLR